MITDANACEVLVVGAGPTGLVCALWLARLGVRVRIIDRLEDAAPFSRALGVHARTLEFYRQMGFADEVVAGGVIVGSANLWSERHRVARAEFGNIGEGMTRFPFVLDFAQDQHERLLIGKLATFGVAVERDSELVALEHGARDVTATVRHAGGATTSVRCAYVAGCDGSHSAVRGALGVEFGGGTYERLFYVADVAARGPAVDDGIHVDLDEADLLALFDMKGTGHVRLVGTVLASAVQQRDRPLGFDDVARRPIDQLALKIERVNWFSTYRVHHRVASRFRVGNTFLLGDAAHVHSPVGAQGMNTGIGDAINLAWKLAAAIRRGADDALLDTYEAERRAFALRLVATTDRAFEIASKPGRVAAFVRTSLFPVFVSAFFRLRATRQFLFRTVSQLAIAYHESALSEGSAGRVRAGDRLPWVPLAHDTDNHEALSSLRWQVHMYGGLTAAIRRACEERSVEAHEFAWTDAMARAGLSRGAVYLVRPDGYVAFADASANADRLAAYVERWSCGA